MDFEMANANQAENCRHEHLPSPRSQILRTVNDVSTAQQLSRKYWLHSWKIAGCNHCSTWKNRMLVSSRNAEDQQVLVRQTREMYLSSNMLSHPSSTTNVASVERWVITRDLA
jgi:hypothetical protein